MYKNKKIIGIIPAREGSKGILNKNIIEVSGNPLICYSISEALKTKYLDKIIVSTDSEKIAHIAKKCGAEVPFLRPKHLAGDAAKIIDVMIDLLKKLSFNEKKTYDYIVLLQPTQPLRRAFHIDEAIIKTINNNYKSLLSVSIVNDHPILIRGMNNDGTLENIINSNSTVRRQDFSNYYKVNGAIYINKIDEDFNEDTSLNDNLHSYTMEKKYDLDIDEPFDLEILKLKFSKLKNK